MLQNTLASLTNRRNVGDQDYKGFEFAKELVLVLPSVYPASEDGEERVRCIFKENSITSLHDHCFVAPENLEDYCEFLCPGATGPAMRA